jgi:hypothetical protein
MHDSSDEIIFWVVKMMIILPLFINIVILRYDPPKVRCNSYFDLMFDRDKQELIEDQVAILDEVAEIPIGKWESLKGKLSTNDENGRRIEIISNKVNSSSGKSGRLLSLYIDGDLIVVSHPFVPDALDSPYLRQISEDILENNG